MVLVGEYRVCQRAGGYIAGGKGVGVHNYICHKEVEILRLDSMIWRVYEDFGLTKAQACDGSYD